MPIAPGIGVFQNGVFHGDALDYYYYILAKVSVNLLKCSSDELEIHLDLTHDLNFMPFLTYRTIKEILELFSIFKDVKLKVYNADPWSNTANPLSINIIKDVKPTPKPF